MTDLVKRKHDLHEPSWRSSYVHLPALVNRFGLKRGAEVGVAFGGHCEAILDRTGVELLDGVDPYRHQRGYDDPMNLPQAAFDTLRQKTLDRLARFGGRYRHFRETSEGAIPQLPGPLDFVSIDADHSHEGVKRDLGAWFGMVREGGVFSGHDSEHPQFPGVQKAVDEFFGRLGWTVTHAGDHGWWGVKGATGISFVMPMFNAWGFGLRQAATGARLGILPGFGYRRRFGHESYWVRQSKATGFSVLAGRLVEPWADRLPAAARHRLYRKRETTWFETLPARPLFPRTFVQALRSRLPGWLGGWR